MPFGLNKKKPGAAPAKASAPPANGGRTWEDATGGAAAGSPEKPARSQSGAGKPKREAGGCSIGFVLVMLLVLAAAAGGGYLLFTRMQGGGAGAPAEGTQPTAEDQVVASLPTAEAPGVADVPATRPTRTRKATAVPAESLPPILDAGTPVVGSESESPPANAPAVNVCGGTPQFLARLKITDPVFSVDVPGTRGLFLTGTGGEGEIRYQHQSWSSAGYMQAFGMDRDGNLYLAPSPRTGPGLSAPLEQDRILKVDTAGGELKPYLTLPGAGPASAENPHGVMGLAIDCESNSLYVTTVTGSTAASEVGRLFRVDLGANAVAGQLDNIDGYGAAVLAGAGGKQLVFGSTRDSQLRAVGLDEAGNFQGEPQVIGTLADPERAREIYFTETGAMVVRGAVFQYASAEVQPGTETTWQYDAATSTWTELK